MVVNRRLKRDSKNIKSLLNYNIIATTIEHVNKKSLSQLSIFELIGSLLLEHEDRFKRFNKEPLEKVFKAKLKSSKGKNKNDHGKNYEERETSYNHGRGKEILKIKGSRVNNQNGPYCKLCKITNHNTNDCCYKCKRCKKTHSP